MKNDLFSHKADSYDKNEKRVENVDNIARAIADTVSLNKGMEILDFGSGTGLLLQRIAPHVKKITAVDVSPSMNDQLLAKAAHIECELETVQMDLTTDALDSKFDGIISSMTMHHIKDIPGILQRFRLLLRPGAFLALADLEPEDGSFHDEDTGIFHLGFNPEEFAALVRNAGFQDVRWNRVSVVQKPQGEYPVFLITAFTGAD
ncbi:MAG: methyltransferase domain-containing protein [Leptospiraceae bacterium]|nr:methyltransferase domain-containing protein [Leptospiraceae bacterium]